MKPASACDSGGTQFPRTDYFFHSSNGRWPDYWWASGGDEERELRKFHSLTRECLLESARERAKEMVVFALVVVTAAWPVGYMVVSVVKLLIKGRPLDH